ncbi:Glyceraldehyde 3-phosphate dehydrogenase, NAD(P) binding domain [Dillenia turbinata]|uniref:Glyceraldehyde 3-phosphate dehydrogenase, NAD(P) binding domain n=1 Tax=Dillenia turbinata TaxID=194707 RepID=A0AAN8VLW0_9MAGN
MSKDSDKKIKIGINGFGRIGRLVARVALQSPDIDLVNKLLSRFKSDCMSTLCDCEWDSLVSNFKHLSQSMTTW